VTGASVPRGGIVVDLKQLSAGLHRGRLL